MIRQSFGAQKTVLQTHARFGLCGISVAQFGNFRADTVSKRSSTRCFEGEDLLLVQNLIRTSFRYVITLAC